MRVKSTFFALVMLLCIAVNSNAAILSPLAVDPPTGKTNELTPEQIARLEAMKARVAAIRAMDRSTLTKVEKKALKQELKDMQKEAKAFRGGVYLSVGAIIIIILLLIILL